MTAPARVNPYAALNGLRKTHALVAEIDHISIASRWDPEEALGFVQRLGEQQWDALAKMADIHRPEGHDHIHPPSKETQMAVRAIYRERVAEYRHAARTDPDAAADAAGRA